MGRTAYTEPQCLYKGALYLYCVQEITFCVVILYAGDYLFCSGSMFRRRHYL